MSSRQSTDTTSASGVNYTAGAASASTVPVVKNIIQTKNSDFNTNSLLAKNGAFNGHAVEVWADGAVWDTVSSSYLFPGRDFNPGDIQRR